MRCPLLIRQGRQCSLVGILAVTSPDTHSTLHRWPPVPSSAPPFLSLPVAVIAAVQAIEPDDAPACFVSLLLLRPGFLCLPERLCCVDFFLSQSGEDSVIFAFTFVLIRQRSSQLRLSLLHRSLNSAEWPQLEQMSSEGSTKPDNAGRQVCDEHAPLRR